MRACVCVLMDGSVGGSVDGFVRESKGRGQSNWGGGGP